ncbi:MAG: hypothetical protein LBI18_00100 [Planctomycetaceae bacterium]|jgi:hypothetical protein|nr:hypothetical protein [Planctomycetaceae bacterium]
MFRRRVFTHHHVGASRLDPVFGKQFVLPSGLESDCQPEIGAELPNGNATVDENPSAKGRPPERWVMLSQRWVMFRRNITSAIADLTLYLDGNLCYRAVWNLIASRTKGLVGYRRRDRG